MTKRYVVSKIYYAVIDQISTMEGICKQIPSLAEKVFQNLGDQDLINLKESNRYINSILNNEQFFAMRIINGHFGNFIEFKDLWEKVAKKAPKGIVIELGKAVQKFFIEDKSRFQKQWNPFWIATHQGSKLLFKHVINQTNLPSPFEPFGLNEALFMIAEKGHTEICKLIIESLENKNPSKTNGRTPLHEAAKYGHADICRILMKNVANKNPGTNTGWTDPTS